MVGQRGETFLLRIISDMILIGRFGAANALNTTLRQHALGRHFDQAELERSAADVGHEDVVGCHWFSQVA